jgi:hypothetical protein
MAEKKSGKIVVPMEQGQKGIPPGLKTSFPGKNRGIVVPSEQGQKGMPMDSYPGGRGPAPLD